MSIYRGELPGFYFDREKGKYYRIQANHRAPQGSTYSKDAIKAQLRATQQEAQTRREQNRARGGCILRKYAETDVSLRLRHRHGEINATRLLPQQYVENLSCRACLVDRPLDSGLPQSSLSALALSCGKLFAVTRTDYHASGISYVRQLNCSRPSLIAQDAVGDRIRRKTGMTALEDGTVAFYVGNRLFVQQYMNDAWPPARYTGIAESVWDIAGTVIGSGHYNIAIASDNGLFILTPDHLERPERTRRIVKEQMAVAFQDDPRIVMSGQRNGKVVFTDIRVSTRETASMHRLHHYRKSSGVNGLTTARHPNQIIVSSLRGTSLYDLRYTPKPRLIKGNDWASKPLVNFGIPKECLNAQYGQGKPLAYMKSLDIAVITSHRADPKDLSVEEQGHGQVTLYQASTGRALATPRLQNLPFHDINDVVVGRVRDGMESIFVGTSSRLFEFNVDLSPKDHSLSFSTPRGDERITTMPVIGQDCFPPNSRPDIVELWDRGDRALV